MRKFLQQAKETWFWVSIPFTLMLLAILFIAAHDESETARRFKQETEGMDYEVIVLLPDGHDPPPKYDFRVKKTVHQLAEHEIPGDFRLPFKVRFQNGYVTEDWSAYVGHGMFDPRNIKGPGIFRRKGDPPPPGWPPDLNSRGGRN